MNSEQRTVFVVLGIFAVMIAACVGLAWIGYALFSTGGAPTISLAPGQTPSVDRQAEGVVITAVFPNSPADEAGLLPGHVILEVNNTPIPNAESLRLLIEDMRPGENIVIILLVNGELRQTTAVRDSTPPYLGIEIINRADFTPDALAPPAPTAVGTADAALTIAQVLPGSPAAAAGLQVGDVIIAVDEVPIRTQAELVEAIGSRQPRIVIALTFQRGIDTLTRSVTLGSNPNEPSQGYLGVVLGQ